MASALPVGDSWKEGNEEDMSEIRNCYCPNCGNGNATTLMLPTKVPGFREIIVVSFICDDCNFRNSEVSFGGEIQPEGSRLVLQVNSPDDLDRQVLKSDSATLLLPALQLEIPSTTQRGTLTTIEGVLSRVAENLSALQPERLRLGDVDNFHRCRAVIESIQRIIDCRNSHDPTDDQDEKSPEEDEEDNKPIFPFELILDDPSGNSYIENPHAPKPDPNLKKITYERTPNQDMSLGLQPSQNAIEEGKIQDDNPLHKNAANKKASNVIDMDAPMGIGRQEVIKFSTTCSHCYKPAETDMCVTDIPHFKEVIIMSLFCENCGFKSNEIKGGGAIPKYGALITLKVTSAEDLGREVLKSDTAGIEIPEIEMELEEGGLDGVYTTVEGLMEKLHDRLTKANPFGTGDSATKQHLSNDGGEFSQPSTNSARYMAFLAKIKDMSEGKLLPFTLIISDPLANSFVGPIPRDSLALSLQAEKEGSNSCYENYVDPGMEVVEYERTHEQNETLGLNDMKTEGYNESNESNYGTDQMEEVPDRIRRIDIRGPDHPHEVGKAPVEGDTTVMGAGSANFSVPSIGMRGKMVQAALPQSLEVEDSGSLRKLLHDFEHNDKSFIMNETFDGSQDGMVFKDGAQGLGYYQDKPLLELWEEQQPKS